MIIDPISDMLTRIRNAAAVKKTEVRLPYSNIKFAIGKILAAEGFVASIDKTNEGHGEIRIALKYEGGESRIRHVSRVSSPGHRVYSGYEDLPRVLSDQGIAIVSTSQGLMTNKEARKRRLGGEVLCNVY
jgi:small subunit ribosomal protein S8